MMARPKKKNKDEMATVKIENAFWKLLETENYSDITVLRISQESGTNRNSFYYHYKDINDLAYTAFMNNASGDASETLMSVLLSAFQSDSESDGDQPLPDIDPEILMHSKKVMLCASSDSVFLNHLVRDLLKQIWFDALSINEKDLSAIDILQINFIFSGLTTVLGSPEINASPLLMSSLSQTEIGKAAIAVLKNISIRQNGLRI